jgi:hypothetical protein
VKGRFGDPNPPVVSGLYRSKVPQRGRPGAPSPRGPASCAEPTCSVFRDRPEGPGADRVGGTSKTWLDRRSGWTVASDWYQGNRMIGGQFRGNQLNRLMR